LVVDVSIVTGLITDLAQYHIASPDAIAADRIEAAIGAGVSSHFVVIIAFLAGVNLTVTTALDLTSLTTTIADISVSIIAFLANIPLISQDSITANGRDADVGAIVTLNRVTVITEFDTHANRPVTAASHQAIVAAAIGIDPVAIITGFIPRIALERVDAPQPITATR
jgi:hypothetical protein